MCLRQLAPILCLEPPLESIECTSRFLVPFLGPQTSVSGHCPLPLPPTLRDTPPPLAVLLHRHPSALPGLSSKVCQRGLVSLAFYCCLSGSSDSSAESLISNSESPLSLLSSETWVTSLIGEVHVKPALEDSQLPQFFACHPFIQFLLSH